METSYSGDSGAFPWWSSLIQGIFILIIGILLLTDPAATTVVIVQFIGIYWLVAGIFGLVSIFMDSSLWGLKLLMGILGVLAGLSVMQHPWWSAILLPTILVVFMGVEGLVMGVAGLIGAFKGGGWGAGILGAISILFGLLLLGSPMIAGLTLPWVYGVLGTIGGIAAIVFAFQQRKLQTAS